MADVRIVVEPPTRPIAHVTVDHGRRASVIVVEPPSVRQIQIDAQFAVPTVPVEASGGPAPAASPQSDPVIHHQLVASSMWTIAHNLGRLVDPIVFDENDCRIIGEVRPDSDNQVTLIFSEPVAGSARIF